MTSKLVEAIARQLQENAFCATGPGGGVDPTCGKEGGGERQATPEKNSHRPGTYQVKMEDGSRKKLRVGDVSPLTKTHLGSRVGGTHKANLFDPETGEHVGTATRLLGGRWVQDKGQGGPAGGKIDYEKLGKKLKAMREKDKAEKPAGIGEKVDRAVKNAGENGYDLSRMTPRQVAADLKKYDSDLEGHSLKDIESHVKKLRD